MIFNYNISSPTPPAMKSGGRYRWLWLSTVAHGLTVECVSYWLPDIDSFWHAQSMVNLYLPSLLSLSHFPPISSKDSHTMCSKPCQQGFVPVLWECP